MTSEFTQAEKYLLEQIRQGDSQAWSTLVDRYQGRLLAFARSKLGRTADAEDLVQETFIGLLKGVANFRELVSLETYLFIILRRKVVDYLRGKHMNICLLRDVVGTDKDSESSEPFGQIAGPDRTASWYASRDEQGLQQRDTLSQALREMIQRYKDSLNFRELKIVEMLFYCQLPNKQVARLAESADEKQVALLKHRCLKRIRERVAKDIHRERRDDGSDDVGDVTEYWDRMLRDIWEIERLSCPKRSTIGAYLLNTLEGPWHDYVDFHLNTLGCRFCRANLDDLKHSISEQEQHILRSRIMESTVGFFHKG